METNETKTPRKTKAKAKDRGTENALRAIALVASYQGEATRESMESTDRALLAISLVASAAAEEQRARADYRRAIPEGFSEALAKAEDRGRKVGKKLATEHLHSGLPCARKEPEALLAWIASSRYMRAAGPVH